MYNTAVELQIFKMNYLVKQKRLDETVLVAHMDYAPCVCHAGVVPCRLADRETLKDILIIHQTKFCNIVLTLNHAY